MRPKTRQERVAYNEALFREANERLSVVFDREVESREEPVPFLCECANPRCTQTVLLSLEEYTDVREHGARFFTLDGHEEPGSEVVVKDERGHQIVEKRGEAAAFVERLARGGPLA